eukprot:GSMAST32.ASY1.ANO1.158.1 assembled CDS
MLSRFVQISKNFRQGVRQCSSSCKGTWSTINALQISELASFKSASHVFVDEDNCNELPSSATRVSYLNKLTGDDATTVLENADCTVTYIFQDDKGILVDKYGVCVEAVEDIFAKGGNTTYLHYSKLETNPKRRLFVLVGESAKADAPALRSATNAAISCLRKIASVENIIMELPNLDPGNENVAFDGDVVSLITRSACLSNYSFSRFKNESTEPLLKNIVFASQAPSSTITPARVEVSTVLADATIFARDLGNLRADIANPAFIESLARQVGETHGDNLSVKVLQQPQLHELGMNLLAAVGQGAAGAPRLITLEYFGDPENTTNDFALVGKGVTFDTGGLNLKPTGSIEGMHLDMCGAASVLAAIDAIAKLKVPRNVIAVLAVAENAIDAASFYPMQIVKGLDGRSVEVGNTDAEGRLCLADACSLFSYISFFCFVKTLTYTQREYNPKRIIDMATLTGACVVALGEYAAGLFTNDNNSDMTTDLTIAEHRDEILEKGEANHADLKSIGDGRPYGGSCTAAAYLESYIDDGRQWAHIDIAGPAMYSKARGEMPAGATGFGAALLVRTILGHKA